MALDRFVSWKDNKPTDEQLLQVLEDFLGGVGEISNCKEEGHPWWLIKLPGKPTFPLRRALSELFADNPSLDGINERWFEVYVDDDSIDVMTRMADSFTNAIAGEFAALVRRAWSAKRGLPGEPDEPDSV